MAKKLGKLNPQFSNQDFLAGDLLNTVVIPPDYDYDALHPGLSYPMYANDVYGCCVISGRAHQTLRFEQLEQNKIIPITDQDVVNEYFSETHGKDIGLVVSQSLRLWRRKGWTAAGAPYKARAYARIDHTNLDQVRLSVYADVGVGIGFLVPNSALDQFDAGKPWDVVANDGGIAGGHYVYIPAYSSDGGFTCVTWGARQKMTEAFFRKYIDEAWFVVDAANSAARKHVLNVKKLDDLLKRAQLVSLLNP